ncbi:unnamed protein product [Prorocentrum cordatum]|uniref:Alpha-1,4-N-acetylglucosaminyltransferase n=1 Tax=Prorocentrum cordatum TaxID=2364126 RepID=A0ABN9VNL4_9DINO|nr:unnamed protein product [Polarella glacialis]
MAREKARPGTCTVPWAMFLLLVAICVWMLVTSQCSDALHGSVLRGGTRVVVQSSSPAEAQFLEAHGVPGFLDGAVARMVAEAGRASADPYALLGEELRRLPPRPGAAPGVGRPTAAPVARVPAEPAAPSGVPPADPRCDTVYTYWDYPKGPSLLVQLNLDTWRRHAPEMKLVLINESNIRDFVPDLPEEFFQLPYPAAKSDFVRASVLYHNGGLYMDTDFMMMLPLRPVLSNLESNDIISYSDSPEDDTVCQGHQYSSNWLAAKKGNVFHEVWWQNMRHKLTRMCDAGEFKLEKICCHEAFAPLPEKRKCHIPWAQLEWLKDPSKDADSRGPPRKDPTQKHGDADDAANKAAEDAAEVAAAVERGKAKSRQLPPGVRLYCLNGRRQLAPHHNGEIYWQPWDRNYSVHRQRPGGPEEVPLRHEVRLP